MQLDVRQIQEAIATSGKGFLSPEKTRDAVGRLAIRLGDRTHQGVSGLLVHRPLGAMATECRTQMLF
jgi:hypothetical protein